MNKKQIIEMIRMYYLQDEVSYDIPLIYKNRYTGKYKFDTSFRLRDEHRRLKDNNIYELASLRDLDKDLEDNIDNISTKLKLRKRKNNYDRIQSKY